MPKYLRVTMPDATKWDVAVDIIAKNKSSTTGIDIAEILTEFEDDEYMIEDWAANNMNWDEVQHIANKVEDVEPPDYKLGWMDGDKEVVEY